jgi:hypothetical protein
MMKRDTAQIPATPQENQGFFQGKFRTMKLPEGNTEKAGAALVL